MAITELPHLLDGVPKWEFTASDRWIATPVPLGFSAVECAPDGGQFAGWELIEATELSEDESHGQTPHSIEFKRQIAQDFIAGETLHALASRHDISRNRIRIWVRKFEAGAFDDDAQAADLLQDCELTAVLLCRDRRSLAR